MAMCLVSAVSVAAAEQEVGPREQAAKQTAVAFMKELGGSLNLHLAQGDAVAAITVCKDIAPTIANRYSRENGWKVTRVGTRVRNPMIGTPDAWEQEVLVQFEERIRRGENHAGMSFSEVVSEPGGQYFRYMQAIGVAPACLSCHGDTQAIGDVMRKRLQLEYPHDQAVGYQVGELRGAVSIKQPLATADVRSGH
jgi:hypothetical protein